MAALFTADVFGSVELALASGATLAQIEHWTRVGILIPFEGAGPRRLWRGLEPILDATEAGELTAAGYSKRQIRRRLKMHRAALASVPAGYRDVERFKRYISTITGLAQLFGPGPDFREWLDRQERQLEKMEQAARAETWRAADGRLLNLFVAGERADDDRPLAECD